MVISPPMLYSTVDLEILSLFAIPCIVLNFCSSPVLVFLKVYLPLPEIPIPNTSREMYLTPRVFASSRKSLTFEYSFNGPPSSLFFVGFFLRFLIGWSFGVYWLSPVSQYQTGGYVIGPSTPQLTQKTVSVFFSNCL